MNVFNNEVGSLYVFELLDLPRCRSGSIVLCLSLRFYLLQRFLELRPTVRELFLTDHPRISLRLLCEQDRLLRSVSRLLSYICLPPADPPAHDAEANKANLSPKNATLNRSLLTFVFPLLSLFGITSGILTLRWGGQDDDPTFLMR